MLSIGIVGLPNVGKSTLFKALTKNPVDISNYPFCTIDPNVGIVRVPDDRLEKLAATFHSKKIIPTIVEFHDIAGLVKNAAKGEGLGNAFLSHIRQTDAICEVVRCFSEDNIVHVEGNVNPKHDMEIIHLELILADLETIEKSLKKASSDAKSGKKDDIIKKDALMPIKSALEDEKILSTLAWNAYTLKLMKELGLLTRKPFLIAFNISEKDATTPLFTKTREEKNAFLHEHFPNLTEARAIPLAIKLEADFSELSQEDITLYRNELDISPEYTGLNSLISAGYVALNLITFLTTGEDETRAWTITKGSTAPQAGGCIHSDFEEKFIRAEVISWNILLETGSWSKARELGKLKTVGRDYVMQDGDVIEIKI